MDYLTAMVWKLLASRPHLQIPRDVVHADALPNDWNDLEF